MIILLKKFLYYIAKITFILFFAFGIVGILVGISVADLSLIMFYFIWTAIGAILLFRVFPFISHKLDMRKTNFTQKTTDTVSNNVVSDNSKIRTTDPIIPSETPIPHVTGHAITDPISSYVVIDVETTGLNPAKDSLIEVAALKVFDDKIVSSYASLINPNCHIEPKITSLTGITDEDLCEAPSAASVLPVLYDFIDDFVLVGHNVTFDINFLRNNFERYLSKPLCNNYIDTLSLSRLNLSLDSYKLSNVANHFNIKTDTAHRALADCNTTHSVYQALKSSLSIQNEPIMNPEYELLASLEFDNNNPFYGKRIAVKGKPQVYSYEFMQEIAKKCSASMSDVFYSSSDYIIFAKNTYKRFLQGADSNNFTKAKQLAEKGSLTILSEEEFYNMLNIPLPSTAAIIPETYVPTKKDYDQNHPLFGKICVFTGDLEKYSRNQAFKIVSDFGGLATNNVSKKTNYLISSSNRKTSKLKRAEELIAEGQDLKIISESEFYDLISK